LIATQRLSAREPGKAGVVAARRAETSVSRLSHNTKGCVFREPVAG
jgi:hypothetical protein